MSDPYGSYDNPYGAPPPFPPQPAPPPPQPWQGPPPPPPGHYPPPQAPMQAPVQTPVQTPVQVSERRPGTVTAAAVLTFVLSGLTILVLLIGIVGVIGAHVDPGPDPDDALSGSDAVASLIVIGVALLATVTAIVLAGLALGRRQGPRVTLVVLAILDALVLAVIATAMIVDGLQPATSAGEVVGGVVVLVFAVPPALCAILLLLPSSGRWYAGRPRG